MEVRDFRKTDLIAVKTKTPIMDAQQIMREKRIKRLPANKKGGEAG